MLRFRVLGPLQVAGDRAALPLGAPKQRVLLACLLLRRGRFVPREELVDAVWSEDPPESAVRSLQVYVHGLRRVLGPERIETRGVAYRIRLASGELDLERFEQLVEQGRAELAEGSAAPAARTLREAMGLWQGPALGDLPPQALLADRMQLEELRLAAHELLTEAELATGQHDGVVGELTGLIAEHPYRERLREQHIVALYRSGRQKEALEAYREARRVFVDELGIEPGPRLRELEGAILRQEPGLAPPRPARRPAVVALPAPPTRLIGREREVAEVLSLFWEDGARLVTLTGTGGTGKTRLALAAAERLADTLPDGARFIDLGAVSEPELLVPAIADALGVQGGRRPLAAAVAEHLRPLSLLLVLDNLEQLLPATTAIAELLTGAPRLLILATSRVCLHLRAEHEYPVSPLPLPEEAAGFEAIAGNEAVRLLDARARAANRACSLDQDTAAVFAHICRRLDGLPLAIELAAARMRTLSPEAVAAALDRALELLVEGPRDLPARQRTLRAAIDWSHDLLTPAERRLFACLASFAGGFGREDVGAVAGVDGLETLGALVELNLVRPIEGGRLTMLETIREYACECLELRRESEAVRARHCRHFLALAERAHEAIMGGEGAPAAYRALEQSHDNLRAALVWADNAGEVELEVRMACALRQFWLVRGHLDEGRTFFQRAVAATAHGSPEIRAQALMHGGPFVYRQGDLAQARAWWEEALGLLNELNDPAGAARCVGELAAVAFSEGDLERAHALYARSAESFAGLGDRLRLAIVDSNLAEVAALREDLPGAINYAEQAVSNFRELGDPDGLATALNTLARLRQTAGEMDRARRLFAEALAHARRIGYREIIANCVQGAAELTLAAGDAHRAARLQAVARNALAQMGVSLQGLEGAGFARTADVLDRRISPAQLRAIEAEATDIALEAVVEEALAVLRSKPAHAA